MRSCSLIVGTIVMAIGCAAPRPALADCISLGRDASPCTRFRDYPEIFIARVAGVESVTGDQRVRVRFEDIERIKGTQPTTTMVFEQPIEGWQFMEGQRVIVYTEMRTGAWSNSCGPTRIAADATEITALRALRDRRSGGTVTLWTLRYSPDLSRQVVVRSGTRIVGGGRTGGSSAMNLGWLPAGSYAIDFFDLYGRHVKTMPVTVQGCTSIQFEP